MPDLRKILFGAKNRNYVDVTRLAAPSRRKAPFLLRRKKKSKKFHLKITKAKKIKIQKPFQSFSRKKIVKKEKLSTLSFFGRALKPSLKAAKPARKAQKSVTPLKKKVVIKSQKNFKSIAKPEKKSEVLAGEVTHFFDKIQVCVVNVDKPLKVGDQLHFKGNLTDFSQKLDSMQIDHKPVMIAKKGEEIGLKVKKELRVGDKVFIV